MRRSHVTASHISVILGPGAELHSGIHGELTEAPPPGVAYFLPDHRHRFLFPRGSGVPFDPFRDFAVSQTVEFALPPGQFVIAHSSRLPVFNRVPWLVETDCLLAMINFGTFYALGIGGRIQNDQGLIRQR